MMTLSNDLVFWIRFICASAMFTLAAIPLAIWIGEVIERTRNYHEIEEEEDNGRRETDSWN